jgi:UPF0755 protein
VRTLVVVVLAALLLALGLQAWWVLTPGPAVLSSSKVVELPKESGFFDIVAALDQAQVIRSPVGFALLALAKGSMRSLKAGEYQVPQGANSVAVLRLLEGGQVLKHPIVFREGSSLAELGRLLEAERLVSAADVQRVARDPMFLRQLDIRAESLEGYLFPDTYQFVKGMTAEEILARMVTRLSERLTPGILAAAEERGLSLHQLLTLASIIEKEAVERNEMTLISAVFWNRLRIDMPLQADPTVQYAVGRERQRLTREDLVFDHPYNTYRRPGLPPGPIASPGLHAIRAAVTPASVGYLYFVAIDDRRHRFSTTLADHNKAVAEARLTRAR